MSAYFTEANSAQVVNERMAATTNPRLQQVMGALVSHLHELIKEVQLSPAEWESAIAFLTATGKMCSDERQEFILLSDCLGLSMLVDAIHHRRPSGATENTVFGPFFVAGAPEKNMGDCISLDKKGELCLYEGVVTDLNDQPVANARIHAWSDNAEGFYDVQQPGVQPQWNNRGVFTTGADGRYHFLGIKPVSYPIPADGPVGKLLQQLGRHPYRPAHMHFMIEAPGYEKVITHTFVKGDQYLASDTVFGVKQSLVTAFEAIDHPHATWRSTFDFVLVPQHD